MSEIDMDNDQITIHRSPNRPVMVDTKVLLDSKLSFAAKGMYAYIQSLPEEFRVDELIGIAPDATIDTVTETIEELAKAGYLMIKDN